MVNKKILGFNYKNTGALDDNLKWLWTALTLLNFHISLQGFAVFVSDIDPRIIKLPSNAS